VVIDASVVAMPENANKNIPEIMFYLIKLLTESELVNRIYCAGY
jgi:hypothetical protein